MRYDYSLDSIPLPDDFAECEVSIPAPSRGLSAAMEMGANLRLSMAKREPVAERRPPQAGDLAILDIFCTCGWQPVAGMCTTGFPYRPGITSGLPPEAEALIALLKEGDSSEATIVCPDNHPNESLRGKKIVMRITLCQLFSEELPAVDDEFAKKFGCANVNELEDALMKRAVAEEHASIRTYGEQNLLSKLLADSDFTPPSAVVDRFLAAGTHLQRMELLRAQVSESRIDKVLEEMRPALRAAAEGQAKAHVYLLAAAAREGITLSDDELDAAIARMAAGAKGSPEELRKSILSSPAADELREKMLVGKTLAHIYDKARKSVIGTSEPAE